MRKVKQELIDVRRQIVASARPLIGLTKGLLVIVGDGSPEVSLGAENINVASIPQMLREIADEIESREACVGIDVSLKPLKPS